LNQTRGYWFKSSLFEVEPGEDEETNPRLYGRQLAIWLGQRFASLGYEVEDVIPEDWGWCVMCQRDPYLLWVGCVNLRDYEHARPGDPPPPKERLLWNAVPTAEVPFFKYVLRRKPETQAGLERLDEQLRGILEAEPRIEIVDEALTNTWFELPASNVASSV